MGEDSATETIYDIANKESHLPALKTFPINNRAVKRKICRIDSNQLGVTPGLA